MIITPDKAKLLAGDAYEYAGRISHYHALVPKSQEDRYKDPEYLLVDITTGRIRHIPYEQFSDDERLNRPFMKIENKLKRYDGII